MSKILFLTSSHFTGRGLPFNTKNEFVSRMQKAMHKYNKGLFITASPDDFDGVIFGISAGSMMSSAMVVSYDMPSAFHGRILFGILYH